MAQFKETMIELFGTAKINRPDLMEVMFNHMNDKIHKAEAIVELYADTTRWKFSAHNSIYKNWTLAHPSDQEMMGSGKYVGGKIARDYIRDKTTGMTYLSKLIEYKQKDIQALRNLLRTSSPEDENYKDVQKEIDVELEELHKLNERLAKLTRLKDGVSHYDYDLSRIKG